jgi:PhoH-like ATPase
MSVIGDAAKNITGNNGGVKRIDDAQNLTPHEIKTITSRAGHGTKIVLTRDPYQIDNPYLDVSSNGLKRVKGQEILGI